MTDVASRLQGSANAPSRSDGSIRQLGVGRSAVKVRWFVLELLLVAVAYLGAVLVFDLTADWNVHRLRHHLGLASLAIPVWALALARARLYQARFISTRLQEWRRLLNAAGVAVLVVLAASAMVERVSVDRGWAIVSGLGALVLIGVERELMRRQFGRARRSGRMLREAIIVGANAEGHNLRSTIEADPELGYRFVGFVVTDEDVRNGALDGDAVLGRTEHLESIVETNGVDNVILAGPVLDPPRAKTATRNLVSRGVHVELSPTLPDTSIERVTVHQLGPHPLVYLEPASQEGTSAAAKRVFDVVFASAALLVLAPLLVAVSIAIKIDSRGPVFYRQERVGHSGRLFDVLKFRSMRVDADELRAGLADRNDSSGPLFKMRDDPRVTRVGRFIRRLCIDELPQFWNVVRGDMSVVGPRPALLCETEHWPEELHHRLRVRPGITGMWQIKGADRHSFDEYIRLDLYYVDNWSLLTDLSIVLRTIPSILSRSGD